MLFTSKKANHVVTKEPSGLFSGVLKVVLFIYVKASKTGRQFQGKVSLNCFSPFYS